jgi:hypothetical protein
MCQTCQRSTMKLRSWPHVWQRWTSLPLPVQLIQQESSSIRPIRSAFQQCCHPVATCRSRQPLRLCHQQAPAHHVPALQSSQRPPQFKRTAAQLGLQAERRSSRPPRLRMRLQGLRLRTVTVTAMALSNRQPSQVQHCAHQQGLTMCQWLAVPSRAALSAHTSAVQQTWRPTVQAC